MDSRLLNVFHDDPFDGNYVKYENDADFWASGSDTMGLQLTETLNGILPIAPTEDVSVIYDHTILKDEYVLNSKDDEIVSLQTKNVLLPDNNFSANFNDTAVGAIEIITVDPHALDRDNSDIDELLEEIDDQSQYSNATFRSRTDSSSIGDYESHTSDYDEDDSVEYNKKFKEIIVPSDGKSDTLNTSFKLPEDASCKNKNRTISINTIGSDVDGLGLQIDANTFDLAEFITQDDFAITTNTSRKKMEDQPIYQLKQNIENTDIRISATENDDSDTDSDVIVDVETVEIDAEEEKLLWLEQSKQNNFDAEIPFVDNVRDDPSWSPAKHIKKSKEVKKNVQIENVVAPTLQPQTNLNRNFSVMPSKRQCDLLKGKFGSGHGKNLTMQRNSKALSTKCTDSKIGMAKASKMNENSTMRNKRCNMRKVGVGQGGKNLALIKHERHSISELSSEENANSPNKDTRIQLLSIGKVETDSKLPYEYVKRTTVKRKLNLEEYKQRRGENVFFAENMEKSKIQNVDNNILPKQMHCPKGNSSVFINTTPTKHSEAVTSVVKSLKGETISKPNLDPITEAKNKVLRMQELKKAQLLKIIDSTVSAKVPRVTKVLPLKDIVNDTYKTDTDIPVNKSVSKSCSDYEEIVIVSASCNTDISIPPIHILPNVKFDAASLKNATNHASRSLLKSSALLYNISNTFQKVQATENVKLSTNSLIVSIQDVVVKQTTPSVVNILKSDSSKLTSNRNSTIIYEKNTNDTEQHGEDKIIMHLRKDRIRNRTVSSSVQTDILPEFPPLPMPMPKFNRKSRERRRQKQFRSKRIGNNSANSMSFDDSSCSSDHSRSYRSRSRSCSSSTERLRRSGTTGGYSSLSSRHHRSSLSSSYSESERNSTHRNRKSNYKQRVKRFMRTSSNSSSDYSDRSRSRTRSRSPINQRNGHSSHSYIDRNVSQPAVEERRIVYVGRIEQETSKEMLRRKFLPYGPIKQITIHYKDTGMKYGFVTYERSQDAFAVIDNSSRDTHINMYDISFGGRRAFCRASYADLDNAGINTYHSYVFPKVAAEPKEEDSFEALLRKVKAKMTANKEATTSSDANDANDTSINNM